jgi:hypothetical protein
MPENSRILMLEVENLGALVLLLHFDENDEETENVEYAHEADAWENWRLNQEAQGKFLEQVLAEQVGNFANVNRAVAQLAESHTQLLARCDLMFDAMQGSMNEETGFKQQFQGFTEQFKAEVAGEVFYQVSQKFRTELCSTLLPEFGQVLRKEISEATDAKLNFLHGNVQEQALQLGTNTVQNLQALTPQLEAIQGGIASTDRRIQLQEEKTDFVAKTVQNLKEKLDQLEKVVKGHVQGELGKFSAHWNCTTLEIKAEIRRCLEASQKKDLEIEAQLASLYEKVGKKFAELDGFNKNSWEAQQAKWQTVEQTIGQFRAILENISNQMLVVKAKCKPQWQCPRHCPPLRLMMGRVRCTCLLEPCPSTQQPQECLGRRMPKAKPGWPRKWSQYPWL